MKIACMFSKDDTGAVQGVEGWESSSKKEGPVQWGYQNDVLSRGFTFEDEAFQGFGTDIWKGEGERSLLSYRYGLLRYRTMPCKSYSTSFVATPI